MPALGLCLMLAQQESQQDKAEWQVRSCTHLALFVPALHSSPRSRCCKSHCWEGKFLVDGENQIELHLLMETGAEGCDHHLVPERSHQLSSERSRPLGTEPGESQPGTSSLPSAHPHGTFRDSLAKAMHEPELAFPERGLALSGWVGSLFLPLLPIHHLSAPGSPGVGEVLQPPCSFSGMGDAFRRSEGVAMS